MRARPAEAMPWLHPCSASSPRWKRFGRGTHGQQVPARSLSVPLLALDQLLKAENSPTVKFIPASPWRAGLEKSNGRAPDSRGRSKYRFQWGISKGLVLLEPTFLLGSRGQLGQALFPPTAMQDPTTLPAAPAPVQIKKVGCSSSTSVGL